MDAILTPAESEALLLSLRISFVAVFCAMPFAVAAALLLARTRFYGKTLVDGLIHVPLVLPPVAIGFLLLTVFGTRAGLGAWLGYDMFVSPQWSVGGILRFMGSLTRENRDGVGYQASLGGASLSFTALYH